MGAATQVKGRQEKKKQNTTNKLQTLQNKA
jgi:hypothetical protein